MELRWVRRAVADSDGEYAGVVVERVLQVLKNPLFGDWEDVPTEDESPAAAPPPDKL